MADTAENKNALVAEAEDATEALATVKTEIAKAVFGQEHVIELALAAILAGGARFTHRGTRPRKDTPC